MREVEEERERVKKSGTEFFFQQQHVFVTHNVDNERNQNNK